MGISWKGKFDPMRQVSLGKHNWMAGQKCDLLTWLTLGGAEQNAAFISTHAEMNAAARQMSVGLTCEFRGRKPEGERNCDAAG